MLPGLIVAGAPKCGTSSIFRWLADHPEVAPARMKETAYFVDPESHIFDSRVHFSRGGFSGYEELFAASAPKSRLAVEATPSYLYSELALQELPRIDSAHFLFIVREPLRQLQSMYSYFRSNWNWIPPQVSFDEFIALSFERQNCFSGNELARDAVRNAAYVDFLVKWRDRCGSQRVHVFLFEDVFSDASEFMRLLCRRLGLDEHFYEGYGFPKENETYSVRYATFQRLNIAVRPWLPEGAFRSWVRSQYRKINTRSPTEFVWDPILRRRLLDFYAEPNRRLGSEFGLDVRRWKAVAAS